MSPTATPMRHERPVPGAYARRVVPKWAFTVFDASERLGVSVRHIDNLLKKYEIPVGIITRRVRLADGSIHTRRIRLLTPTALEKLMLRHAGYQGPGDAKSNP